MWVDQLRRVSEFCGVKVLTYVVLDNHFHLLVRVPPPIMLRDHELVERYRALYPHRPRLVQEVESALREGGTEAEEMRARLLARMHDVSMFLKEIKQRFTMWFNARHKLYGTIWAERFKSILVESDASVLQTVGAYIDLNPLRAKLVKKPEDYRWSGMAAAERGDPMAQAGLISMVRGDAWEDAREIYRRFVYGSGLREAKEKPQGTVDTDDFVASKGLTVRQQSLSEGWIIGSPGFVSAQREVYLQSARNC
jgi:hypothetical protein